MDVQKVLHVVGGAGVNSYAANSNLQKTGISKSKPIWERSILHLCNSNIPKSMNIAELGCSSGPNALVVTRQMIDVLHKTCQQRDCGMPELRVFLNDLPGNDFNTLFLSLPSFCESLKEEKGLAQGSLFIAGVPGSFYGRLFPNKFIDFIHSSYSVHWLSEVPQGLQGKTSAAMNKGNIYMAKSSDPSVFKAYLEQFERDFSLFLKLRSEEISSGGQMALTFIGRKYEDPSSKECCYLWELLAQALMQMVSKGIIEETKVDSFNLPYYTPSVKELEAVIEREGSFVLDEFQVTDMNWDINDNEENEGYIFAKDISGENVAKCIRAATESMIASHFGEEIIDELFERYAKIVGEHLMQEKTKHNSFTISLTKRA